MLKQIATDMARNKEIKPIGSTVVSPYLMVESVEAQMEFLVNVFNAKIRDDSNRSNGQIQHGEVLIGDTPVMMGRAGKAWPSRQSMNYVYVDSTDEVFQRALTCGATEILGPVDRPYGVREAGFADKFKNQWWVAELVRSNLEDGPGEEELLGKREKDWNQAIAENRVEDMAAYMAADWVIYQGDGNMTTKQAFLDSVANGHLVHTKMDFEIQRVRVFGHTGIVMQKGTSEGTWFGKKFSLYEIATTVFIKNERGWQAVYTMLAPAVSPMV